MESELKNRLWLITQEQNCKVDAVNVMWDTDDYSILDIPGPAFCIPDPAFCIPDPAYCIPDPAFFIPDPVFLIPVTAFFYTGSGLLYTGSDLFYRIRLYLTFVDSKRI